jgi:uncharacterized protein (UPF0332 family)
MSVSGADFYNIAVEHKALDSEIGYRNCVSRAYYSMYHSVLAILKGKIPHFATGGVHHRLIEYLVDRNNDESHDSTKLRQLSYILKHARDLRHNADYEIDSSDITQLTAEDALNQANRVMSICEQLKSID